MGCVSSVKDYKLNQRIEFDDCFVTGTYSESRQKFAGEVKVASKDKTCSFRGVVWDGKFMNYVCGTFAGVTDTVACTYLEGVKPQFAITHMGTIQFKYLIATGVV